MTYRKLEKHEFDRVKGIFEIEEWVLPSRDLATIFVAEDEQGRIMGMLVMEFKLHAEPLWIRPDAIGKVSFNGLATEMAKEVIRIQDRLPEGAAVYFMTGLPNVEKLAEGVGFLPMEEKCWKLEL